MIKNLITNYIVIAIHVSVVFSYPYFPKCQTGLKDQTLLETLNGKIKGECYNITINYASKQRESKQILTWFKVPYAEAPIDNLRFKNPIPIKPWNNIKDGTKISKRCIPSPGGDFNNVGEDCLYLNIFVPYEIYYNSLPNRDSSSKSPILVWIHGGTFLFGDALEENNEPSTFVAMSNLIFISINYRISSLGFLYLNGTDANGNQGFYDQKLALKWIYDNAFMFGGDKNRITIGGDSAGAFSVALHMIHEPSWPFFTQAIMQSGMILDLKYQLVTLSEATRRTSMIASKLNCTQKTNQEILICLQSVDSNLLAEIAGPIIEFPVLVLDYDLIHEQPYDSFKKRKFKPCNILIGTNTKESAYFAGSNTDVSEKLSTGNMDFLVGVLNEYYKNYPFDLLHKYPKNFNDFITSIVDQYLPMSEKVNKSTIFFDYSVQIATESTFRFPSIQLANYMSEMNSNVYMYLYGHHISTSPWKAKYEAVHSEELYMVFAEPLSIKYEPLLNENPYSNIYHNYSIEERLISEQFVRYWNNFIQSGNPSNYWLKFNPNNNKSNHIRNILYLNGNESKLVEFSLNDSNYLFWTSESGVSSNTNKLNSFSMISYLILILTYSILSFKTN